MGTARSFRRRRHRWLSRGSLLGALIVAALAFVAAGTFVAREHARTLQEGERTAGRLAQVLEEQTLRSVQAVDLTLLGIADSVVVAPRAQPHDPAFEDALRRKRDQLPFVRALFVIGADGFITQDTDHPHTPRVTLADRPYFRLHRENPTAGLHIGPPLISRSVGTWFISMSRRVAGRDGDFEGVVVAGVEPRYFERFYERLHLYEGDSVALFLRDSTLLSGRPYHEGFVGTSFAHIPLFQRELPARPQGSYRSASHIDGVRRIVSYRTVEGAPLVVAVGLAEEPLLAGWRRTALATVTGTGMTVALLAALFVLLARDARRRGDVRERLAQAQKLEALGRMTGGIAHDVNNVLNVVLTNLELIRRSAEPVPATVERALRAVTQGTRLVEQLLAFARQQALAVESRDANRLVSALLPLARQAAGPAVEIGTDLATDLWPCLTDDVQFTSAVLNLVVNARDAMPHGTGEVRITTRNRSLTGGTWRRTLVPGDYVQVTVVDNGGGMPPDVLRHAAEPFFTTKADGTGTGLGLSQTYGFAKQVGGDLRIESTVGVGTAVHLFFRRASGEVLGVVDDGGRRRQDPVASPVRSS